MPSVQKITPLRWVLHATIIGLVVLTVSCSTIPKTIKNQDDTSPITLANLELGIAYMNQGRYENALTALEKAKKADPNYSYTYSMLGILYQQLGDIEKAQKYFKQSLKISADPHNMNNYGQFLCAIDQEEKAQKIFEQAIAHPLYDQREIALTNAGTCAMQNNDLKKAEEFFLQALIINPQIPSALIQMAQIQYEKKGFPSARKYLTRYQQISAHTSYSLWLGIKIEKKLGDKNALSSYALRLRNDFPDSKEATLLLESGLR